MAAIVNDRDALIMGAVPRYTPPANIGLFLSPESAIFKLSADQSSALPGSFTFKALPPNAEGVVTFTWSPGLTFTVSGNTATLTYANFTAGSGTLTATIDVDGVTYTKTSTITKLADGAPGAAGTKSAPVFLYQWSASAPAAPTGTSTLTWATGINSNYTGADGWAASAPANPGTPGLRLYVVTRTVTAAADVATTSGISYLGLTAMAWTQNGAAGVPGLQSAAAEVYQWAATIPAGPVGNPTWNWNTRQFGAAPANWTLAPGAPIAGHTLWAAVVQLVDSAGATGTAFNWNTASIVARGYAGSNGSPGSGGAEGASYVTAYVATAVGTASTAPAPTTGKTSLPAPNSSGLPGTPQATVPQLTAGQYLMQFDGVYNPVTNQVTWSIPYQASLKVGSLSAITTNTGALTVTGDLSSANGLFKVDANGLATMRAVQIMAADGTLLFSTGAGLATAAAAPGTLNEDVTWDELNNRPLDSTNMVTTPVFPDLSLRTWDGAPGAAINGNGAPSTAFPHAYSLRVTARDTTEMSTFNVFPGEKFYTSATIFSGNTPYSVGFGLVIFDQAGQVIAFLAGSRISGGFNYWLTQRGSLIIPAGATKAAAWVQIDGFTGLGHAEITNMILTRSEPGATVGATWGTDVVGSAAVDAQILAAKTSADAAMVRVNAEADNNVLDRGEKPGADAAWAAIEDERPRLILQAQDVSVSYAAYDAAKQSLSDYLVSLPGGWNNTLTDTPIDRATYVQKWNGYYTAKVELLKAVSVKLQSNVNYVQGQATAAQNAANTAQGAANAALVRVNAEADNNVLDRGEKPEVLAAWLAIEDERPRLILQAQDVSVSYADYDNAKQSLSIYLQSLPGGPNEWYNTLTDTPIVRDTYILKWNSYYAAKVDLLKAISAKLQSNVNYVQGQAVAAQNAANTAQGAANTALVRVNAEADNNTLDRGEKPGVLAAWSEIEAERPKLVLQAQSLSVSYAAYDAAKQALADYLVSLPGGQNEWYNTLTDTPIDRATYISKWNGYYAAKVDLANAIAARAAVLASWAGVTGAGKPADNATVGGTFGPNGNITGQMTVAQVPNHIPANGITDALIGGNLKSTNWNGATDTSGAGWLLERATGNLYCNSIRARGAVMGGGYTGYVWPTSGVGGFYLGPEGLLLGNPSTGRYLQVESNGTLNAPGFSIANGRATLSGNVNTGVGSGFRIEMGPDDPVYAMWAGSGDKTDSNAIFYLKRGGQGYFGGSLSAGMLRTAVTNPSLDANVQLVNGPFGTNGSPITVVCSYEYSETGEGLNGTYSTSGAENTATIQLYRTIAGVGETLVQTVTASGATTINNASVGSDEWSRYNRSIANTFTFTDNAGGSQNRTYRAVLSGRGLKTVEFTVRPGQTGQLRPVSTRQTLSIITTE